MTNLFSVIKNAIMQNYTPTYGDLINENKGEVLNKKNGKGGNANATNAKKN